MIRILIRWEQVHPARRFPSDNTHNETRYRTSDEPLHDMRGGDDPSVSTDVVQHPYHASQRAE